MEGYEESASEGGGEVRSTTFRISVHSSAIIYSITCEAGYYGRV